MSDSGLGCVETRDARIDLGLDWHRVAATFWRLCGPEVSGFSGSGRPWWRSGAPERRYEPEDGVILRLNRRLIYALIAAISGRMPRMFMTRVRL